MSRVLPILFNTDMVRAILDGRKTVTRRIVKQSVWENFVCEGGKVINWIDKKTDALESPTHKASYKAGDILYVRETWSEWTDGYVYRAWTEPFPQAGCYPTTTWHPSIHMPKEAARIWLRVTDVRMERLQNMWASDVSKEGIYFTKPYTAGEMLMEFSKLWNSTIPKKQKEIYEWNANPWVWVIEFERCEKPESETDISKRIEECSLQKEYGAAGRDGNGACLGFGKPFDDEPIEQCKQCIAYTGLEGEE